MPGAEQKFDYRPRVTYLIHVTLSSIALIALGIFIALTIDRGPDIDHGIRLDWDQATLLPGVVGALGIGCLCYALALVYRRVAFRPELTFGSSALTAPRSRWTLNEVRIPYSDIRDLVVRQDNLQYLLRITYAGGRYTIKSSLLPSKRAFQEVCDLLVAKTRAVKSVPAVLESGSQQETIAPDNDANAPQSDVEDVSETGNPDVRRQHYLFAHRVLRDAFFSDPQAVIERLSGSDACDWLHNLWFDAFRDAISWGQDDPLPSDGFSATSTKLDGRSLLVVELPHAQASLEAYFIALLFADSSVPRYLTLEDTARLDDEEPRAVLCEWLKDGAHCNHARYITPNHESFVAEVDDYLREENHRS